MGSQDALGQKSQENVAVYEEMHRCVSGCSLCAEGVVNHMFGAEVVGEVITIRYPDESGIFAVKIIRYYERRQLHMVDSHGLSLREEDEFNDLINLNEFYRDGHITFYRHLCQIYREVALKNRQDRKEKREAKAQQERQERQTELDAESGGERKRRPPGRLALLSKRAKHRKEERPQPPTRILDQTSMTTRSREFPEALNRRGLPFRPSAARQN